MKRFVRSQRHLHSKQNHQKNQSQQLRHRHRHRHQFIEGSLVEVSSYEEDFEGVWFAATVIKLPSYRKGSPNFGKFYVQYKDILDDEDNSKPYRDYVYAALVRPLPPVENHPGSFNIGDNVDAFCNDGWWTGVVTKIVEGSRFVVTFQHPPDEVVLCPSDLRIHRKWVNGSWVPPANQDVSIPSDYRNDEGYIVKIDSNIGVETPLTNSVSMKSYFEEQTPFSSTSRENKIELAVPSSDKPLVIDFSPREMILDSPLIIGKEALNGEAHACVPSPGTSAYKSGTTSDEKCSLVASQDYVSAENDILRQPLGADQSHKSHSLRKRGNTKRVKIAEKEENALVGSRKTEENKVQVKKMQNSAGVTVANEAGKVGNEAEDVPGDCLTVDTSLPVVLGLACDNLRTSGSKRSYRSNGEETVKRVGVCASFHETKLHVVKVTNQFEVINGSQKKRRGRPPKSLAKALTTSILDVNVEASAEASALGQVLGTNGTYGGASDDHIMQDNQLGIKSDTSPSRIGGENDVVASRKQCGRHPTIRGRKQTTKLNLISKVHDVASPGSVEGNTAEASYMNEDLERDIVGSPDNTLDNLPLSKWKCFGSLRSPTSIDSSGSSLTRCIAKASGEHMEIVKEGTAAVDEIRHIGIVLQNSPFEKKSTLWSALESMEVFQKLPQKLHFQPLEHVKESLREGLAVGCMVTFTGVVERTSKLQFDDPKCSADDILETLLELETHGFDVGGIRERVSNLRHMKERQEKLEEEVEKLNNEMAEHELEKSKIDEEMEGIKKQIKELQEKLSEATSVKQIKNGEIESLQLKLKGKKEGISSIRCEFEGQGLWP